VKVFFLDTNSTNSTNSINSNGLQHGAYRISNSLGNNTLKPWKWRAAIESDSESKSKWRALLLHLFDSEFESEVSNKDLKGELSISKVSECYFPDPYII
jgi:hypothetical protein